MTSPFLRQVKEVAETGRPTVTPEEYTALRSMGHSDEDIRREMDVLDPPPEHPYAKIWNRLVRPAAQGASLGFSDELRGAVEAAGAVLPGGRSPGQAYIEGRNAERTALDQARKDAPIVSRVAEFAGGMLTPGGAFLKAGKGAGILGKAAVGGVTGAAAGGLAGAGYSAADDPDAIQSADELGGDVATGTIAGGVGGAVVGGAIGAGQRVASGWRRNLERAGTVGRMIDERGREMGRMIDGLDTPPPEPRSVGDVLRASRASRGMPLEGQGPKPPTQLLRQWPARETPVTPLRPDPVLNALAEQAAAPPGAMPSAAETAARIRAATMGGKPSAASVDEVLRLGQAKAPTPAVPAQPYSPTQRIIGGPGVSPPEMGQKGFASTITGKGWAGGDDVSQAIHEMYAQTGGPDDFSDLLQRSIDLAKARKPGDPLMQALADRMARGGR